MKIKFKAMTLLIFGAMLFSGTPILASDNLPFELELPTIGTLEGTGTYFKITNSEYLNITIDSEKEINLVLESIPKIISLNIEPVDINTTSTKIILSGLEPNKTYYKYQDSHRNMVIFVSNNEGVIYFEQDLSFSHHIWFQEQESTVFLPEDCEDYGIWDEDTSTCILTQDLIESVEITENNITLDCDGHSITGNGSGYGIYLYGRNSITIKNCEITDFSTAIYLIYSSNSVFSENIVSDDVYGFQVSSSYSNEMIDNIASNNTAGFYVIDGANNDIRGNTIENNEIGFQINQSDFIKIEDNNILNNQYGSGLSSPENAIINNNYIEGEEKGIYFRDKLVNNTITNNVFNNGGGFYFEGSLYIEINNNIFENNTINGKPLVYLKNQSSQTIDNAGQVIAINCDNIIIKDLDLSNVHKAIQFIGTINSTIDNVKISDSVYTGIHLFNSSNNTISNCDLSGNVCGIDIDSSSNNTILNNKISSSSFFGFRLYCSTGNVLKDNSFSNCFGKAISLYESNNNFVYHNNLINNYGNVGILQSINSLDNGYPDGGNYYSDYSGTDAMKGENQDEPGSDGISDTPLIIFDQSGGQHTDNYPFMEQNGWENQQETTYEVVVILAETGGENGIPHTSSSIVAQPCKLIDEKTYEHGYSKEYYEDLAYCVTDYHRENSFGTINLEFEILDNGGNWFGLDGSEGDYLNKEHEFVIDAINLATSTGVNLSDKNMVIVLHSGTSYQKAGDRAKLHTRTWALNGHPLGCPPYKILVAEDDMIGAWAHEIGHVLGAFLTPGDTITPDIYEMGNVEKWDLMARGSWNKNGLLGEKGTNPPNMSSYTKEFLGWLNYDIHSESAYGEYWINSLETSELGDSVFRYNLTDDINDGSEKYYILEARNRNLKSWDSSLPEEKALVLYKVDTKGYMEYGYVSEDTPEYQDGMMWNQYRKISIPYFDGLLTPDGDSHLDIVNLVYISALSDEQTNDTYKIKAKIEKVDYSFFQDRFQGAVLNPSSEFDEKIIQCNLFNNSSLRFEIEYRKAFKDEGALIGSFSSDVERILIVEELSVMFGVFILLNILLILVKIKIIPCCKSELRKKIAHIFLKIFWIICIVAFTFLLYLYFFQMSSLVDIFVSEKTNNSDQLVIASPLPELQTSPDLDLHLYCDDGRHIGMNYETGEYEIDIPEAIVSGDNQDSPEWIFLPDNTTNCHFIVSAYDNQRFLEQNPEIAEQMENTNDSYEIYARYIDPETDIYTSNIISEDINVGEEIEHKVSGNENIIIDSGILINNSPFFLKQKAIIDLELIENNDRIIKRNIQKAIYYINKSLNEEYWIDDTHLDSKQGRKVFTYELRAVARLKLLEKLIDDNQSLDIIRNVNKKLTKADYLLAETILNETKEIDIENHRFKRIIKRFIVKAEKELIRAKQDSENNKPEKSIIHSKKSWLYSQMAIKFIDR